MSGVTREELNRLREFMLYEERQVPLAAKAECRRIAEVLRAYPLPQGRGPDPEPLREIRNHFDPGELQDVAHSAAEAVRGWHYPPELPPERRLVLVKLVHDSDPQVRQEWAIGSLRSDGWSIEGSATGCEPLAQRERWGWRLIAWHALPEPPAGEAR